MVYKTKRTIAIIIGVLVLMVIGLVIVNLSQKQKNSEQRDMISAMNDTVKVWRDRDSLSHSKIEAITTERVADFTRIEGLTGENKALQDEVKRVKDKLKQGGAVVNTSTEVKTQIVTKTDIIRDTVIVDNKVYPIYTASFDKGGWVQGQVKAGPQEIVIDPLKVKVDQTLVLGSDKTGFLGLGKSKAFVEVTNKNPYAETKQMKVYVKDNRKDSKFWYIVGGVAVGVLGGVLISK